MLQLIINGLGLAGSGASLLSSFSVERDLKQIRASLARLEGLHSKLEQLTPESILNPHIELLRSGFEGSSRLDAVRMVEDYARQLRNSFEESTRSLVGDVLEEMRRIRNSVVLLEGSPSNAPPRLFEELQREPTRIGIRDIEEISSSGLFGAKPGRIVDAYGAPIYWRNPLDGREFLGTISHEALGAYGVQIEPPKYKMVDGHIYSPRHGLYLPHYLVEAV